MSIKITETTALTPDDSFSLCGLPPEKWEEIAGFTVAREAPLDAARNIVNFGRVCQATYGVTQNNSVQNMLAQFIEQHYEDVPLLKIWDSPSLRSQLRFNGPRPTTVKEIKAWFENPANTEQLNAIQSLSFRKLGLQAIPPQIKKFTQLRELDFGHNELTTIPAGMFDPLTQLTKLSLTFNQLKALPEGLFDRLAQLTGLYLGNNHLTTIPFGLFNHLPLLDDLLLFENQITALPAGLFDHLTQLVQLNLCSNQLTAFPEGLFEPLTQLRLLGLSDNRLTGDQAYANYYLMRLPKLEQIT